MEIGGIRYSTRHEYPTTGSLDGVCCETCVQLAYDQIREEHATIALGAFADDPIATRLTAYRFKILGLMHVLDTSLPAGLFRKFLLTGIYDDYSSMQQAEITSSLDYSARRNTANSCDYKLRMAMAYLNEAAREHRRIPSVMPASSLRRVQTYLDEVAQLAAGFTCRECDRVFTDLAITTRAVHMHDDGSVSDTNPNVCRDCLDSGFIHLPYQGIYVDEVATETVEVNGITGRVTAEWAEENCTWVASESDDEESDGYWTTGRPSRRTPASGLMEYNANPFDHFSWDARNRPNALVFGVELEMEPTRTTDAQQTAVIEALGGSVGKQFILKSDGSLNYGVELVTMPFTLAQHLDDSGVPWKKTLAAVSEIARSGDGTTACGIHIHINKKALSALTIGKMLVFLNSPDLAPLITIIAQRQSGSYCQRSTKKLTDGVRSSENRYDIMNVSVRHPTCEIRMFRGNLTVERIYKNIEFCHALVQYCRQASMRTLADWGNFSQWLIAHRGQYQNLVRFLVDKKAVGFRQLARDTRDGTITIKDR